MSAPETRTSTGIAKTFPGLGGKISSSLDLTVSEVHGRIHLRRVVDRRFGNTDVLTDDEAEHLGGILIEQARRSRAAKARAA